MSPNSFYNSYISAGHPKGLVRLANGFVTEEKRTKHAEFRYPVTKFISDARHITTVHQTGVSVCSVLWKVLNMLKTSNRKKRTPPDIAGLGADSPDKKQT